MVERSGDMSLLHQFSSKVVQGIFFLDVFSVRGAAGRETNLWQMQMILF